MTAEWICVEQTPDRSAAARVEAYLKERGIPVRVVAGDPTGGELEVQVPVDQLTPAVAGLSELDAADEEDERRPSGP